MIANNLQSVADQVVRRAARQGHIVPREVREELSQMGQPTSLWKDVLALARPSLSYRQGRYHFTNPVSERVRQEQSHQQAIERALRQLVREHRKAARDVERRTQDRVEFIHPVTVHTPDGQEVTLLTRDLSPTGIRLVGTRRLLGQKVRVTIPGPEGTTSWTFLVRILWTCPVGDDLVENGGTFLEVERHKEASR
jgi:hypothetical protein